MVLPVVFDRYRPWSDLVIVPDTIMLPPDRKMEFPSGLVWLVGAGPGDPGLLTLHALDAVSRADVVVHDALVSKAVLELCRCEADLIYSGKRGGKPSPLQADISLRLISLSREGKRVVRLKGGDPFIFGRGSEEVLTLIRNGVPVRVTPGISAGYGGLAYAGIPLTCRDTNQSVTFLTGHDRHGTAPATIEWSTVARGSQVIVMYMAMKNFGKLAETLMNFGRPGDDSVAIVCNATLPDQVCLETTLENAAEDIDASHLKAPAVICIGINLDTAREISKGMHDTNGRWLGRQSVGTGT